jgi:hypothetical protein
MQSKHVDTSRQKLTLPVAGTGAGAGAEAGAGAAGRKTCTAALGAAGGRKGKGVSEGFISVEAKTGFWLGLRPSDTWYPEKPETVPVLGPGITFG